MKIFLDNIIFSLQRVGGISVYWYELLKRYNNEGYEFFYINHKGADNNVLYSSLPNIKKKVFNDVSLPMSVKRFLPYLGKLPPKSVFHSSYQRISLQKDVANITTIHDLGYESGKMRQSWKRTVHLFFKKMTVRRTDGFICISENTKKDLLTFYSYINPENVRVIYNGISNEYRILTGDDLKMKGLPSKFILYVGARDAYKNFKLAVAVVSKLKDFHLVVAGGKSLSREEKDFLEEELPNRYCVKTNLSTEQLCELYNRAFCLLYLSSYEGFGIPVAEAMRCNCPVIAFKGSSIPEVAGEAGILLDILQPEAVLEAVKLLETPEIRKTLIDKGQLQSQKFSWDKCAAETFRFYQEVQYRKF